MKKTTLKPTSNLAKRLTKYSALTIAIAGIADANGQIIHTDVDPDFVGTLQSTFDVDFDSNAVNDATVLQTNFAYGSSIIELIRAEAPAGNGIVANVVGAYTYGVNVPYGTPIGSSASVESFGDMCQAAGYTNSQFCGTTEEGFVGVSFDISGNTHYGWIRIAAGSSSTNFTIMDFAYESSPDTPINAGEQPPLNVENQELSSIKVVAFDKNINLSNLPETTNYRVYSITGKLVLDGTVNDSTYVIEANGVASGIYIIELTDVSTNKVLRKKIAL